MKPLLILFFGLITNLISAQGMLTRQYGPSVGLRTIRKSMSLIRLVIDTGSAVHWQLTYPDTGWYIETDTLQIQSSNGASGPRDANLKIDWIQYQMPIPFDYYKDSSAGLYQLTESAFVFLHPRLGIPYGLGYRQSRVQNFSFFENGAYKVYKDSIKYAGYGILTMNGTAYTDCILLRRYTRSGSTPDTNVAPTYYSYNRSDEIYAPGIGLPVFRAISDTSDRISVLQDYLADIDMRLGVKKHSEPSFKPSPNPATTHLTLPDLPAYTPLTAIDAKGRSYCLVLGSKVDISVLPPGLYMLQVGNKRARFVKQ